MINTDFWKGKRVFVTGHTGFKGSWLCMWLYKLGAEVTGYALEPPTNPSLFETAQIAGYINSLHGDVRDYAHLSESLLKYRPEIVFHMAAQPLVRESYKNPVETYDINVLGTVKLLEAVRTCRSAKAVVNVTTDKCYENREWVWGYRENDALGGYDPYSNSKACSELVTASFRDSFFNSLTYGEKHGTALASARAGNVIGGGDWAKDRLVPDCIRSLLNREKIFIRNPRAIRPWQHVLEPLSGYMVLAQRLFSDGMEYTGGWNFGPDDNDIRPVEYIVKKLCTLWENSTGHRVDYEIDTQEHPHEAHYLKLDCSKAGDSLQWHPRWNLDTAIIKIVEWTEAYRKKEDIAGICFRQIEEYEGRAG